MPRSGDLAADPDQVLAQAHRALHSGGKGADEAIAQLQALNLHQISTPEHQLVLGDLLHASEQKRAALVAWAQAVTQAQCRGVWHGESTTPPHLLAAVSRAIDEVRRRRRELYFACYDSVRVQHGEVSVARVDQALSEHLKQLPASPRAPGQRPRFFFFPGLNTTPFMDPALHAWTARLVQGFSAVQAEALSLVKGTTRHLESFVRLRPNDSMDNYLAGDKPAWDACFFYRHGRRFDDNHARFPATSQVLEAVPLCRIADHAPEICFSVLAPHTTIRPHFGVTNVRAVMHLPLLVPPDCALHVLGHAPHVWQEGVPMMFDDTFEHAAWNHSDHPRVILLMDCWNPGLSQAEQLAVSALIEVMGALHKAAAAVG